MGSGFGAMESSPSIGRVLFQNILAGFQGRRLLQWGHWVSVLKQPLLGSSDSGGLEGLSEVIKQQLMGGGQGLEPQSVVANHPTL